MASAGSRRATFFLGHSWPPLTQIACAVAREDIIFSTAKQYPSMAVVVLLNYGTGAEERRVLLALFEWAVIQRPNTNPAQLINTGSRERRGRNNDAVKSGFMNMEQCLILHYYGCYLKTYSLLFCWGLLLSQLSLDGASDSAHRGFERLFMKWRIQKEGFWISFWKGL